MVQKGKHVFRHYLLAGIDRPETLQTFPHSSAPSHVYLHLPTAYLPLLLFWIQDARDPGTFLQPISAQRQVLTFSFSNNTGPFETTSVLYVREAWKSLVDKIVSDRACRCLERVNSRSMAGLHLVSSVAIRDELRVADQIPHRGVRCCGRLPDIQVCNVVMVRTSMSVCYTDAHLHGCREKGDQSKLRDFLPADKQYLLTRGVPCLRRATSLAYTDEDEDRERLLKFGDLSSTGNEEDEWVETHAGRSSNHESEAVGEIDDPVLLAEAAGGHVDDLVDLLCLDADERDDDRGKRGLRGVDGEGLLRRIVRCGGLRAALRQPAENPHFASPLDPPGGSESAFGSRLLPMQYM